MSLSIRNISVLVVEDEALLRMEAADMSEDAGLTVFEAGNADEAILILEHHPEICILFTDIHIPGSMDGIKLSHYARRRWPPLKIIVTSGQSHPGASDLPGGSVFLPKPVSAARFAREVREMMIS